MTTTARAPRSTFIAAVAPRTAEDAAQLMWTYYRDHKQQLIADIRLYRADILAQLTAGLSPEAVFEPFGRPAEPVLARRRAA